MLEWQQKYITKGTKIDWLCYVWSHNQSHLGFLTTLWCRYPLKIFWETEASSFWIYIPKNMDYILFPTKISKFQNLWDSKLFQQFQICKHNFFFWFIEPTGEYLKTRIGPSFYSGLTPASSLRSIQDYKTNMVLHQKESVYFL